MRWFLFTAADAPSSTPHSRRAALRGSSFFRMRATTCLRSKTETGARVGLVPETMTGSLSAGVRESSIPAASRQRFSRFGLETWPNKPDPANPATARSFANLAAPQALHRVQRRGGKTVQGCRRANYGFRGASSTVGSSVCGPIFVRSGHERSAVYSAASGGGYRITFA